MKIGTLATISALGKFALDQTASYKAMIQKWHQKMELDAHAQALEFLTTEECQDIIKYYEEQSDSK